MNRIENDSIGEKEIPVSAYYGVQSLRAAENFRITGLKVDNIMIKSLVEIKKAAAIANWEAELLSLEIKDAIVSACDMIINDEFLSEFIVDPIQGGAGTSLNMNANEVIANIALEILHSSKGNYDIVNPNDHINCSQSTNDVYPSAGKITILKLLDGLTYELNNLKDTLLKKSVEFDKVIKMGRTQLQDAVPIRLGQEFSAYAECIKRDLERLVLAKSELRVLNLGGTAIGTCINTNFTYLDRVVPILSEITGIDLVQSSNLIDATQNLDGYIFVSAIIKTCAANISKISNDLRLMSSGPKAGMGEIYLPPRQNGSSIMPGKINPVIPEVMNQINFQVMGNDLSICMAVEAGQLELNAFEPVIFYNMFQSIEILTNGIRTFVENCLVDIKANEKFCNSVVENSIGLATALCPYIGYKKSVYVAKKALSENKTVRQIVLEENIIGDLNIDEILDPIAMTNPPKKQ